MAERTSIEDLISDVEQVVAGGLAYFSSVDYGAQPEAEWVLRHMVFWHRVSAEGMESVLAGGEPFRISGTTDEVNARAASDTAGLSTADIVETLTDLQARMVAAVRKLEDPEVTVVVLKDGTERPASQRLRMTAFHWKGHLAELNG